MPAPDAEIIEPGASARNTARQLAIENVTHTAAATATRRQRYGEVTKRHG